MADRIAAWREQHPRDAAIRDLVRAVTNEGRSPYWHRKTLARHRAEAPVIWAAIDRLVREGDDRG